MHEIKHPLNLLSKGHITHHLHTLPNMRLKKSEKYNEEDNKYLGLYFTWSSTIAVSLIALVEGLFLYTALNYVNIRISPIFVLVFVLFGTIYMSSFWNTVHPEIHNIDTKLTWYEGIPGWSGWKWLFSNIILYDDVSLYTWFIQNHTMHHLRKNEKKGNYNVTFPGADFILGLHYTDVK